MSADERVARPRFGSRLYLTDGYETLRRHTAGVKRLYETDRGAVNI